MLARKWLSKQSILWLIALGLLGSAAVAMPPALAASPLARPAWLALQDLAWNYSALQYSGLPSAVMSAGEVWVGTGCRGPDTAEPTPLQPTGGAGMPDFSDESMLWLAPDSVEPTTAHLRRSRCFQKTAEEVATIPGFFAAPAGPTNFSQAAALPGHQVCALVGLEVRCVDPSPPQPKVWTLFSPDVVAAALLPGNTLKTAFPNIPANAVQPTWAFRSVLPVPGGSVFALVDYILTVPGLGQTFTVSWVVERKSDGGIVSRLGPVLYDNQTVKNEWPKLANADRLLYDAQSDAVMVYSLNTRLPGGTPGGIGMALLPVKDAAGLGLLDLQQLIYEQSPTAVHALLQGPQGKVYVAVPYGEKHVKVLRLSLDALTRDLDRDGLSAAQETAAGTSDLRRDSDGGGSPDGIEVLIDHTDPQKLDDDSGAKAQDGVNWGYSQLIQLRIPLKEPAFQWQQTPYVCGKGKCYDALGKLVVDISKTFTGLAGDIPANLPALSGDGQTLVWDDGQQVRRRRLGGKEDVLLSTSDLIKLLDLPSPGHAQFIVNNQGRVYVPGEANVAVLGDGPPRILWDRKTVECEAKLGPCAPPGAPKVAPKLPPEAVESFAIIGYDAEHDRLIAAIRTTLDGYVVSFGVDAAPVVVKQGHSFPKALIESPVSKDFNYIAGLYPWKMLRTADSGWFSQWGGGVQQLLNGGFNYHGELQFGAWPGDFSGGWDTSMFVRTSHETYSGLIEAPRLEAKVRKGDLWTYSASVGLPNGLMVSGPRGGLLQLTTANVPSPAAMGASSDGQLCVVMPDGTLAWSTKPDAKGIPTFTQQLDNAHHAVDCRFNAQNQLMYLAGQPSRLGVAHNGSAEEWLLPGVVEPIRFAEGKVEGQFRIADRGAPGLVCFDTANDKLSRGVFTAAGLTVTRGGWLVAMTAPDGRLVRVADARACTDAPEELDRPFEGEGIGFQLSAANLAERPDGLLLAQRSQWKYTDIGGIIEPLIDAYDPRQDRWAVVTTSRIAPAFALVPGGEWCDAWEPEVPHDPARCWTMPAPPAKPTGGGPGVDATGTTGGRASPSPASDSGCSTRPTLPNSPAPALLVASSLALVAVRRSRSKAPRSLG